MNRYEQRRRRVLDQLQFGEMMVLYSGESVACSMDEGFDFEANHHFFYLTGLRRENMALVLANTHCPAHVILFIEEPIPDMERWTGRRVTIDEARAVSGIDDVRYIDSVDSLISRCVARETVEAAYFELLPQRDGRCGQL
ncbi:MAG: aminopeptidase P N-terminal domain-containing protein [Christensenellales bacterium]